MAQRVETTLVCDLTGEQADETIEFGFEGKAYRIDLTRNHAEGFREIMADYVGAAAPIGMAAGKTRRVTGARRSREQTQAIREWARTQGHSVSERGRIPLQIQQAFEQAHSSHLAAVG